METIIETISDYFTWLTLPAFKITDVLEILILAFIIYNIIKWVKYTRAWTLFKGLLVLLAFSMFAALMQFDVILWIIRNTISVGIIALVILFQPELRRALEELGKRKLVPNFISLSDADDNNRFSDRTIEELVKASFELARNKTGALVVIEKNSSLIEYEKSGIPVDAIVSSQLLINIFEHNTPLHDGAVIMKGDRIVSATCYLPLSANMSLSKELGTRHRAAVGVSEVTDSLTIIVSEETGKVSLAQDGKIIRNVDGGRLKSELVQFQKLDPFAQETKLKWQKVRKHLFRNKQDGDD
ncbi:MAG: diadenylate cyclase CdaA [Catonella sp.]|uniref:diadenylate cyclase CdaA n=1 Tax=Catonella sp. TaxID=2382125 RepID=UPI003FA001EB